MAEAQLQQFLEKVRQLNAFVALSEADAGLRQALCDCSSHHAVVELARSRGFEIGKRWGEGEVAGPAADNLLNQALPPAGREQSTTSRSTSGSPCCRAVPCCVLKMKRCPGL